MRCEAILHYYCWLSGVVITGMGEGGKVNCWSLTAGWPGLSPALQQALLLCPPYLEQSGLNLWSVPRLERALQEPETQIMSIKCPSSVVPKRAKKRIKKTTCVPKTKKKKLPYLKLFFKHFYKILLYLFF